MLVLDLRPLLLPLPAQVKASHLCVPAPHLLEPLLSQLLPLPYLLLQELLNSVAGLDLDQKIRVHFLLVLQLVPPASHMRVPGIGVVEAALAQPAVEADHFALLAGHLSHIV